MKTLHPIRSVSTPGRDAERSEELHASGLDLIELAFIALIREDYEEFDRVASKWRAVNGFSDS